MKAYSAKSSAVRAAKTQFGAAWEEKAAVMLATDSQGWVIIEKQAPAVKEVATSAKPTKARAPKAKPTAANHPMRRSSDRLPAVITDPVAPWQKLTNAPAEAVKADVIHKLEEVVEEIKAMPVEGATVSQAQADAHANRLALGWKLSTTEKPTKKVWAIASDMPGKSRKEVIEACIAAGIGAGTARTQYQAWFTAMKASGAFKEQA